MILWIFGVPDIIPADTEASASQLESLQTTHPQQYNMQTTDHPEHQSYLNTHLDSPPKSHSHKLHTRDVPILDDRRGSIRSSSSNAASWYDSLVASEVRSSPS